MYSKNKLLEKSENMGTRWLNVLSITNVYYELYLPRNSYFRMSILCDDIADLAEVPFSQQRILDILWNDFINHIKKTHDFELIYSLLMEREKTSVETVKEVQQHRNTFTFFDKEEIRPVAIHKKDDLVKFRYTMKRKQALRGEVLLADLKTIHPDHHFTVERVLEIIYCDFIEKYRKGETSNVVQAIVDALLL